MLFIAKNVWKLNPATDVPIEFIIINNVLQLMT